LNNRFLQSYVNSCVACLGLISLLTPTVRADTSPENCVVVINADSWASRCIGQEYAAAREIPSSHIIRLRELPDIERIDIETFRERLLLPVLRTIEQRGLAPQIDMILWSSDIPTLVDAQSDVGELKLAKVTSPQASVNGLTFLYKLVLSKRPDYLALNTNLYHRKTLAFPPQPSLPQSEMVTLARAMQALVPPPPTTPPSTNTPTTSAVIRRPSDESVKSAIATITELNTRHPGHPDLLHHLATTQALADDIPSSIATLRKAVEAGWWNLSRWKIEPALVKAAQHPDFPSVDDLARNTDLQTTPTVTFSGAAAWASTGQMVERERGMPYLLSTLIACTSGRGTSVAEALRSLKRSIAADGTRPIGSFHYMKNGDVRSTTRAWAFSSAIHALQKAGFDAHITEGVLPDRVEKIAGITVGSAGFDWAKSRCTLGAGSIGDNLTSFGGAMHPNSGQTPLSEFIRHGAAGASGTVAEPYAIQAKFPDPFIHVHYTRGCTLAEAFYQSVAAPYQLLIVGDALCNPWRKKLQPSIEGVTRGQSLSGVVHITFSSEASDNLQPATYQVHVDGLRVTNANPHQSTSFDTTRFSDGTHSVTVVAVGNDSVATRGRVSIPVVINNARNKITASLDRSVFPWNSTFTVRAEAEHAKRIWVLHDSDEIAASDGNHLSASLRCSELGPGPIRLRVVADIPDQPRIESALQLTITPPPPIKPLPKDDLTRTEPGFLFGKDGSALSVLNKLDANSLQSAGIAKGDRFILKGLIRVDSRDLHQFQIKGAKNITTTVSGTPIDSPDVAAWCLIPMHLDAGLHEFQITGTCTTRMLEVRFGGSGSRPIDGDRIQHRSAD
jgi:hypothetical protein